MRLNNPVEPVVDRFAAVSVFSDERREVLELGVNNEGRREHRPQEVQHMDDFPVASATILGKASILDNGIGCQVKELLLEPRLVTRSEEVSGIYLLGIVVRFGNRVAQRFEIRFVVNDIGKFLELIKEYRFDTYLRVEDFFEGHIIDETQVLGVVR